MNYLKSCFPKNSCSAYSLLDVMIILVVIGFIAAGIIIGKYISKISKIHSQIAQISDFDSATVQFYEKFDGLPGDLLSVLAEREGLAYGDGTPSHGDGDGKISPCSLGWQWNLGCETSLFWSHLSAVGLINENFSADSRLTDSRLDITTLLTPYLPQSPLGDDIYVAVWNSDAAQQSPEPQIPYGNYYEISKIEGIVNGKMQDNANALTPLEAYAIDKKMDDAIPTRGRILVNGNAQWPDDAWGTYGKPGENNCIAPDKTYNRSNIVTANTHLCHIAIRLNCCKKELLSH